MSLALQEHLSWENPPFTLKHSVAHCFRCREEYIYIVSLLWVRTTSHSLSPKLVILKTVIIRILVMIGSNSNKFSEMQIAICPSHPNRRKLPNINEKSYFQPKQIKKKFKELAFIFSYLKKKLFIVKHKTFDRISNDFQVCLTPQWIALKIWPYIKCKDIF